MKQGYQPINGSGYQPVKSIDTNPPRLGSCAKKSNIGLSISIEPSIEHLQHEIEWYKERMNNYKNSFFRVCDIVEHSDCANITKRLVEEERKKY